MTLAAAMPESASTALKLIPLVLSLGLDTFAVAVALGISGIGRRGRVRVGMSFALFEGGMPIVGFVLGRAVGGVLGNAAGVVGAVVLFAVGIWMIVESVRGEEGEFGESIESLVGLAVTSISVSMDELAVGFSMGALGLPITLTVVLIAVQAFVITIVGTGVGNRVGEELAERAETVAGIVLCGLAAVLLVGRVIGR